MSKHIPQVPGQFTEGDEGLPEFWQKEFATSKEVAAAMKLLDITSIQTCPKCRQMWVNLNDEKCRKCGASMVHVVKNKPAATVHRMGSGEATFCKNCGKPIVEDTSGRGWRHGETGPYVCSETYAQPGGAPSVSPTVTPGGETADHVRDYILPIYESRAKIMAAVGYHDFAKDKCECGGCWLYRQLERLGDALTLLQAAETKL